MVTITHNLQSYLENVNEWYILGSLLQRLNEHFKTTTSLYSNLEGCVAMASANGSDQNCYISMTTLEFTMDALASMARAMCILRECTAVVVVHTEYRIYRPIIYHSAAFPWLFKVWRLMPRGTLHITDFSCRTLYINPIL